MLTESRAFEDGGLVSVATPLKPGETLRIVKFVAYGWSAERSLPAVRDQVWAALSGARQATWEGLQADQRAFLDDFWGRADVEVDGDTEVQQAVRFALFHVMQAGARGERRPIPAKGLTGPGYDGHAFWDTETFVLPVLDFTAPDAAASALRWRHSTLPLAKERAAQLGLAGAAFPWRTIAGQECSGYWPAGTAAFHVNADIADAVVRYVDATGDDAFEAGPGIELLTETARLWRSLGHHDARGSFHIDGVTGPDEYSAIADDNVYTNLMAKRNLIAAADAADRHPGRARELGVDAEETASWRDAAKDMHMPYDDMLGVHQQAERFTQPPGNGTSPPPSQSSTRCCCTSPTSTCTASRWSSRPTWCSPCSCAARHSPPSRRRATSSTTSRSRSEIRRCRRQPRRSWRPRSAISTWPMTTWAKPR